MATPDKTTQDAAIKAGAKFPSPTSADHVQARHYLNGLEAERFVFIAVEKTYPYAVAVYRRR